MRAPSGIWTDSTTMWVADGIHNRIFAFDMLTRERRPLQDVVVQGPLYASFQGITDIWSDGEILYVLDSGFSRDGTGHRIVPFVLPYPPGVPGSVAGVDDDGGRWFGDVELECAQRGW